MRITWKLLYILSYTVTVLVLSIGFIIINRRGFALQLFSYVYFVLLIASVVYIYGLKNEQN